MAPRIAPPSTASSIDAWLQDHPDDPTAYATLVGAHELPIQKLILSKPTTKRKVLEDVSSNAMAEKRRRISPSKADRTPFIEPQTPIQSHRAPYFVPLNGDDTPKASDDAANTRAIRSTNYTFSARRTSPSRASTSSSNRSRSPLKRMGDLQFMDRSIVAVTFENTEYSLPIAAKELLRDMRKIASGKNVIPDCLEVNNISHAEKLIMGGELDDYNFGAHSNILIPAQPKNAHDDEEVWKRVGEILYEACLCEENSSSEPAWNTEVHSRILNLVLYGWREERYLSYSDITTARIHGNVSATKMVDYAISLDPDKSTKRLIIEKLKADFSPSINHTKAEYVRFKPIVISIETKRTGGDEDTARVQLGVWAAAHLERLQELSRKTDLPILPQILIHGHDWRLKIASLSEGSIILHGDLTMGDTRTVLGIYKIMAGLRHLCHWAITDYRQWFMQNCLSIDDERVS